MINYPKSLLVAATLLTLCIAPAARGVVVVDGSGAGDTFGVFSPQIDIDTISVTPTATELTIEMTFHGPIAAPSDLAFPSEAIFGYIAIDTNQDGSLSESARSGAGLRGLDWFAFDPLVDDPADMGIDFFVDLGSEQFLPGFVDLLDATTLFPVATEPITITPTSLSVTFNLSNLGGDDGQVDFGAIVGTFSEETDQVFGNTGSTSVIPEPSSVLVWTLLVGLSAIGVGFHRRLS